MSNTKYMKYTFLIIAVIISSSLFMVSCNADIVEASSKNIDKDFFELMQKPTNGTFSLSVNRSYPRKSSDKNVYDFVGGVNPIIGTPQGIDAGTFTLGGYEPKLTKQGDAYIYQFSQSDLSSGTLSGLYNTTVSASLVNGSDEIFANEFTSYNIIELTNTFTTDNNGVNVTTLGSSDHITWNANDANPYGVIIIINNDATGNNKVFITDDDGTISVSSILSLIPSTQTRLSFEIYRGNGFSQTGADGKSYKVLVYSYAYTTFTLQR
jgi:hypothetical protein